MHNERIGDNKIYLLAKEAGLIEFEQLAWNHELGSPTYESVVKARKFAELIVQDLISGVVNRHPEYFASQALKWQMGCRFREYFGVEE